MSEPSVRFTKEEKTLLDKMVKVYIEKIQDDYPLGTAWPEDLMSLLKTMSEYESALVKSQKQTEAKRKMSWVSYLRWKWKCARKESHRKLMLADMQKYTEALKGVGDIDLDKLEVKEINGEKYYILK